MLALAAKGLLIGILVSAPMGPVGMLCIQRTLSKGRWHGFVTGLGAMVSDIIYAMLTSLGMGVVVNFVEANQAPLQLAGSLVLSVFGYYIYQSNVLIVLLYIGLFARFGFILPDHSLGMIIGGIICIGIGAISWWLFITYIVSKLRKWFNVRGIWLMNRIVGSTIIILSIIGIISVLLTYYIKIPLI